MKIIFIFGVIFTIIHSSTSQGSRSRGCERLEEKLNQTEVQKRRFNLNQCGGIHGIRATGSISGSREDVKRTAITQVSFNII